MTAASISIIVVHHLRKEEAEDPLDAISGSTGLTACADTLWVLKRERGRADAFMHTSGRDIDEQELGLQFDKTTGIWTVLGDADQYRISAERAAILKVLRDAAQPMAPNEIATLLGKKPAVTKMTLARMLSNNEVSQPATRKYTIPVTGDFSDSVTGNPSHRSHSSHPSNQDQQSNTGNGVTGNQGESVCPKCLGEGCGWCRPELRRSQVGALL